MSLFDYEKLYAIAEVQKDAYRKNVAFPHIVIDGAAGPIALKKVLKDFPKIEHMNWFKYDNVFENKMAFNQLSMMPDSVRMALMEMNSAEFLLFLERLTGIEGLVPDPHFNGGGVHRIQPGGMLHVHADYNYHPRTKLDRRLNVILYLNEDWRHEWGGELELWDKDMTETTVPWLLR